MKKNILFILLFACFSVFSYAQEDEGSVVKEKDYPVNGAFESGYLIDAQTTVIPDVKTLEFVIQHKFGTVANGKSDLFGIYAAGSNIRLGLDYVLLKNVQIGVGLTKKSMMTDLNAKWTVLQQTRKNSMPISVALYGSVGIDGRSISAFETGQVRVAYNTGLSNEFDFQDRLNYFSQLIVGRKFNDWLSLQAGVSFTHYNAVGVLYDHDKVGVHFNGRVKVSPQGSVIFNYDQPLKIKEISEQFEWTNHPLPNVAIGYEISTGTHAFQIFAASSNGLLTQDNIMWNQNDWQNKGFAIGFVMTRLWGF